ncbi:MAG: N-acetylneuraminate synthase [Lentisphaerae bacterium GWF2_44_16]|nr:MAG: N-acetylneuraminate synthase [Lentisphaerae bacterium GWF2_44_16]
MDRHCFIIAEAGVNHNGSIELALQLCDVAKKAGADAVKFQTFRTENNVLKSCGWVDYQKENMPEADSHWDMIKSLELTDEEFIRLKEYCDSTGIEFISTPSERKSLKLLLDMGVKTIKLSSCDVSNIPLLRAAGRANRRIILSTGMCTPEDINRAVEIIEEAGTVPENITLLHCHSSYPTAFADVNLRVMNVMRDRFRLKVGFSDHTPGWEMSVAAAALGAEVIEKHFTLDKTMEGPDHKMSLDPRELTLFVAAIRNVETGMGDGIKRISAAEQEVLKAYSRGIVAARDIAAGDVFTEDNITVKRPCRGIDVRDWDNVIGRKAKRAFKPDEPVALD